MLFCKCGYLVAHGKYIFRKCFSVLTCLWRKMISVFILPSNTIFQKTERERECVCVCEWNRARAQREREKKRERERGRRESPLPATHELRLRRRPRDFAPRTQIIVRLRLRIAPRSHPLTSLANPEARIARLRLRRLRTLRIRLLRTLRLRRLRTPLTSPRWHRDGTDRTKFAIEKWLGFWWIWPDLCLSIEKWYYIFVWKLRKCEKM